MVNYVDDALKEISPYIVKAKVKPKTNSKPNKLKHIPNGKIPKTNTSNEVQEIQNILRTMSIQSNFNHNPKRKEDMTYLQAVRRGHKLPAMKSSDGDIMPNIIDCRPFNKKKQTDMYEDDDEDDDNYFGLLNETEKERLAMETNDRYEVKKVGDKYMIYDNEIGEFLIGYTFDTKGEAILILEEGEQLNNLKW